MSDKPLAVDGYVIETLMADLVGHDHRPSAFLVYLAILAAAGERRAANQRRGRDCRAVAIAGAAAHGPGCRACRK